MADRPTSITRRSACAVALVLTAGLCSAGPAAAVEKPWTTSGITGTYAWGTWWVGGGRTYIQGTLRDSACDGYGSGIDLVFSRKNSAGQFIGYRTEEVRNRQGCSLETRDKPFNFNSEYKGSVRIKIRECLLNADSALFDDCGDWNTVLTG